MPSSLFQRALLALLPAMIIAGLAASAVWGENGLLARHRLDQRLIVATEGLAALERDNHRLVRDLRTMDSDPIVLERMVAEELGWAQEGAVLYRFDELPPTRD